MIFCFVRETKQLTLEELDRKCCVFPIALLVHALSAPLFDLSMPYLSTPRLLSPSCLSNPYLSIPYLFPPGPLLPPYLPTPYLSTACAFPFESSRLSLSPAPFRFRILDRLTTSGALIQTHLRGLLRSNRPIRRTRNQSLVTVVLQAILLVPKEPTQTAFDHCDCG